MLRDRVLGVAYIGIGLSSNDAMVVGRKKMQINCLAIYDLSRIPRLGLLLLQLIIQFS